MAQQESVRRFDFPLVSEGEAGDELEVGEWVLHVETLYEDRSEWDFDVNTWTFARGDQVGLLYLELARPIENRVLLTATFEFASREIAIVKGVVPYDDGSRRLGGGRLVMIGGTGKFEGRKGAVPLEVRNPKRWG